jgi:hypothetical protein
MNGWRNAQTWTVYKDMFHGANFKLNHGEDPPELEAFAKFLHVAGEEAILRNLQLQERYAMLFLRAVDWEEIADWMLCEARQGETIDTE